MAPKAAPQVPQVPQEQQQEQQPADDQDIDRIEISIRAQSGTEMHFKVKQGTKVSKVIKAYCSKHAVDAEMMRFLFDGQRIGVDDGRTCGELELENGDVIDVLVEQIGGWPLGADGH